MRFLAFLAFLFAPAVVAAQGAADPVLARTVAELQPQVGRDIGRTYHLTAVRAEGRTLALDVEFLEEARNLSPAQMASSLAMGLCAIKIVPPFSSMDAGCESMRAEQGVRSVPPRSTDASATRWFGAPI